jgi:hypothetical protein
MDPWSSDSQIVNIYRGRIGQDGRTLFHWSGLGAACGRLGIPPNSETQTRLLSADCQTRIVHIYRILIISITSRFDINA